METENIRTNGKKLKKPEHFNQNIHPSRYLLYLLIPAGIVSSANSARKSILVADIFHLDTIFSLEFFLFHLILLRVLKTKTKISLDFII